MTRSLAFAVAASACTLAQGQTTFMTADLQILDTGSGNWVNIVDTVPGDTLHFRLVVTYGLATGTPIAWRGLTLRQITIEDWAAGDSISAIAGKILPTSQTFGLFSTGVGLQGKIDRVDNPTGPIQLTQLPPDFGGDASNPIQVFSFSYTFQPDLWWRTVNFHVPDADLPFAAIFTTAGGSWVEVPPANRAFDGATVRLLPTPGTLALLGICGSRSLRRRRD